MEERDQIAGSFANSATLANTVLLLLDRLRRNPATRLTPMNQRSLDSLVGLLTGTANGAKSKVNNSDLSPDQGRSLSQDRLRYDIVKKVRKGVDDKELQSWTTEAARLVKQLEEVGYKGLDKDQRHWIDGELEPFLDRLAQLDNTVVDDDEFEIRSQDIAAA